jgi:hypothetical protein
MSFRSMGNQPPKPPKFELKTLAECWEYFKAQVIPPDASPASVHRAQMCFYAGASFFFDQNMAVGESSVPEDDAVRHIESLARELRDYRTQLATEVASRFPTMGNA